MKSIDASKTVYMKTFLRITGSVPGSGAINTKR
jgi:hypothetical protein